MRQTPHVRRMLLLTTTLFAFALAACGAADQPASLVGDAAAAATPAPTAQPSTAAATTPTPASAEVANAPAVGAGGKAGVPAAATAEWPQWRGPNRDGLAVG